MSKLYYPRARCVCHFYSPLTANSDVHRAKLPPAVLLYQQKNLQSLQLPRRASPPLRTRIPGRGQAQSHEIYILPARNRITTPMLDVVSGLVANSTLSLADLGPSAETMTDRLAFIEEKGVTSVVPIHCCPPWDVHLHHVAQNPSISASLFLMPQRFHGKFRSISPACSAHITSNAS